jgi:hypothetical protein
LSLRPIAGLFSLIIFVLLFARVSARELGVQFKTLPALDQLRPFSETATIIVSVTNSGGTPIEEGRVQIRLDAPKPDRFFSTDFPFVEGSRLLEMQLPIQDGKVQWQYLFPIRGEYLMAVEAANAPDRKTATIFRMAVRENERKWIFLGLFTLGLFFLGFVAGRLFTSSKLVTKDNIAFWVLLFFFGVISLGEECSAEVNTGKYAARLEISDPRVGKLSRIRWNLIGLKEAERRLVNLNLRITHLEKGKTVFALEKLAVTKEFSLNFQFTDGDQYRIEAIAELDGQELTHSQETISVSGIEPPPSASIPAIAFFLTVISLGLGTGRWSRRRQLRQKFEIQSKSGA